MVSRIFFYDGIEFKVQEFYKFDKNLELNALDFNPKFQIQNKKVF